MKKNYEIVFILTPVLSDIQMKDAVLRFIKVITDNKGEIINEEHWGLKKLAYPIQHKNTGFYHLLEFKSEPSLISKLETELRRDEKVLRFLTVSIDKHALIYNERRRKGAFNKKENKEETAKI
jgi:small subunit ribosomal protein S6|tara:strand:- start:1581 stop:1949 length:369 start_codon:yes stop_codon:yes gene_type:complete